MIDYYLEHKDTRFEFIAFHDARAQSLEQMDAELEKRGIIDKYWKGRPIPFPILLDATGETIQKYKVRAFPTTILIDPRGRLVKELSRGNMFEELERAMSGAVERR